MDILVSFIFIIGGVALFFTHSDSMFILGATLIAFGIILLLALRTSYKIEGKEGSFKRKTKNYPRTKKEELLSFINGKSETVVPEAPGSLLLYVYFKRDKSVGYAELNDYVDYIYKPLTDLVELTPTQVKAILG